MYSIFVKRTPAFAEILLPGSRISLSFLNLRLPPEDLIVTFLILSLMLKQATEKEADPHDKVSPTPFSYVLISISFPPFEYTERFIPRG